MDEPAIISAFRTVGGGNTAHGCLFRLLNARSDYAEGSRPPRHVWDKEHLGAFLGAFLNSTMRDANAHINVTKLRHRMLVYNPMQHRIVMEFFKLTRRDRCSRGTTDQTTLQTTAPVSDEPWSAFNQAGRQTGAEWAAAPAPLAVGTFHANYGLCGAADEDENYPYWDEIGEFTNKLECRDVAWMQNCIGDKLSMIYPRLKTLYSIKRVKVQLKPGQRRWITFFSPGFMTTVNQYKDDNAFALYRKGLAYLLLMRARVLDRPFQANITVVPKREYNTRVFIHHRFKFACRITGDSKPTYLHQGIVDVNDAARVMMSHKTYGDSTAAVCAAQLQKKMETDAHTGYLISLETAPVSENLINCTS